MLAADRTYDRHGSRVWGFIKTYRWLATFQYATSILPDDLQQPEMTLPWATGETWYFSGGPHGGWASGSGWAAIDFVPDEVDIGQHPIGGDGHLKRPGDSHQNGEPSSIWTMTARSRPLDASRHTPPRSMAEERAKTAIASGMPAAKAAQRTRRTSILRAATTVNGSPLAVSFRL
jgi:hypothetical protein